MTFIESTPDLALTEGQCAYQIKDGRITFTKLAKNGNPVEAIREDDRLHLDTRAWTAQETLALFKFTPPTAERVTTESEPCPTND